MLPAASKLKAMADAAGAQTVLLMTWGRAQGDPDAVPGDTYAAMQARLVHGYTQLGTTLNALVAPVGHAWEKALQRQPKSMAWAKDGYHPSPAGSYLTACVFYSVLGGEPTRSAYTAGLQPAQARLLQEIAVRAVGGG